MSDETQNEKIAAGVCPICGKPAVTRHRPFCSHRCALIDLGRWLGGNYRVPARDGEGNEEEEETPPALDEGEGSA